LPSTVSYCHCFILCPGAVQFLTQVVEIFPVLNRVFRLRFPGFQERDQSLDFLELTRHSFTMFLVVIPLGEITFSGLAHKMLVRKRTREFQPRRFCFRILLPATRSRTARRNFSRSAGLSMSSLRFIASATALAYATPCCSTNRFQRSSAISSIRLETERFSKDSICSSLFRCSSRTVRL